MADQITTAFVQQYTTNIAMLLQQQGSRIRPYVREQAFKGMAADFLEQFGSVSPTKNLSRHAQTPLSDVPQNRRWVYPDDYDWGTLIDQQDRLRLLIDPAGPYTMAGAWAMGRAIDDEILAAVFGTAQTGQTGTTAVTFPSGQIIANTVGASAATGLNTEKLRAARKLLMAAEVDLEAETPVAILSSTQFDNMLNETQAVNMDYTNKPVLTDGRITHFMGFDFVHSERIPGAANWQGGTVSGYQVPVFVKSGMGLGLWNDIQATVDRRPDLRNAWQVYVTGTFGASRTEELRVVQINTV